MKELNLESFLTKEQANMVVSAVFQGVSFKTSGNEYFNKMHREMKQPMDNIEQFAMDLGKMAENYNRNCQAETLELIRSFGVVFYFLAQVFYMGINRPVKTFIFHRFNHLFHGR